MLALVVAVAIPVALAATNPLLEPWPGPYGGVPPFDKVRVEALQPALEAAMAEMLAAVERIANDPAPPTFENTLVALERAERSFYRVVLPYGVWTATLATPDVQALERVMEPRLAALDDRVMQDGKLFARIATVHENRAEACKTPEQARLAWRIYTRFVLAGARLDPAAKKRVAEINERLATLGTSFAQNVLADEEGHVLVLESERDLAGLPPSFRSEAAASAASRGLPGKWVVLNTRSSVVPFLTSSERRDLREKAWRSFVTRGDHDDGRDNKKIVAETIELRAERARLLGYSTYAHWRLADSMAGTPDRAMALLEAVWPAAVGRVREEVAAMQAVADAEGAGITIAPWDYRHYAEKVRKARYDLDEEQVKGYLRFDRLRDGVFWVAGQLYGLHFEPARGVPVYHPDVQAWLVSDGAGKAVGLLYIDPWARPGKSSGAWFMPLRTQESMGQSVLPIATINTNFMKGKAGEPSLLAWDDARTLFHEFGHALHLLSSKVTYPTLSSIGVPADFRELPSQIMERWLATPELLGRYARHHQTGKPIPPDLVAKIDKAATFNQGFETVEYLSSALVDMKAHSGAGAGFDAAGFERATLEKLGMPPEVVMRHRLPHFGHVFASEGYAASYYSYLWSEVISADAFEAFTEGKGPYDEGVARRFQDRVLSVGNTVDPAEAYRAFRGRDPEIGALLRLRGFPARKGGGTERLDPRRMP